MNDDFVRLSRIVHGGRVLWAVTAGKGALQPIASFTDHTPRGEPIGEGEVRLLAPVEPSKIVCVGRNYLAHARELGNEPPEYPLLFLKPPSAVIGPGEAILIPPVSERVDYEGEIAVVIGRTCCDADERQVRECILGYTALNDVTARDLQKKDGQWTRAKGFDTFAPVGPEVVLTAPEFDWASLEVSTRVNGELKQSGKAADMAFSIPFLVAYISQIMTLLPGDVIATGTPEGVGPLAVGDEVAVEVTGLAPLVNPVRAR